MHSVSPLLINPLHYEFDSKELAAHNLTKNLSEEDIHNINSHTSCFIYYESFLKTISKIDTLSKIRFSSENHKHYPILALRAFLEGKISEKQVATFCTFFSAIEQFIVQPRTVSYKYIGGRECLIIENQKEVDPSIMQTHCLSKDNAHQYADLLMRYLKISKKEFDELISQLETNKLPASERLFMTFKLPFDERLSWSPIMFEVNELMERWGPISVDQEKFHLMVVPSFSMLEFYMQKKFKHKIFTPQPALGKFSTKGIAFYKLIEKRILNYGIPGAELPNIIHEMYAGPLGTIYHDWYHYDCYCRIPKKFHLAFFHINNLLEKIPPSEHDPKLRKLKKLKWLLIDGELPKNMKKFGEIFHIGFLQWQPQYIEEIISNMVKEKKKWEEEFKLGKSDLLPEEAEIYDKISKEIPLIKE